MIELDVASAIPVGITINPMERIVEVLNASELVLPEGRINLVFTDDLEIQKLNLEYAGHDYATDVLSFSYIEAGGEAIDGTLGDMIISVETAARQASKAKTDLGTEVALLALHGTLHILGYDHTEPGARVELDTLQQQLMMAAGLPYRNFEWIS